jgi:hypothetical protein
MNYYLKVGGQRQLAGERIPGEQIHFLRRGFFANLLRESLIDLDSRFVLLYLVGKERVLRGWSRHKASRSKSRRDHLHGSISKDILMNPSQKANIPRGFHY